MLYWALGFLLLALICGLAGFGGLGGAASGVAKAGFVISTGLFVAAMVAHACAGAPRP